MNFAEIFDIQTISFFEMCARIIMAAGFGLVLGIDRDAKNKPIDFRAYMVVAVAACVLGIMGLELQYEYQSVENGFASLDLGKIISGVVTGIGFLGAGAIIHRKDDQIVGTATGASIWAAGGMGLALGFGMYALSIIAFVTVAIILIIGGMCMKHFYGKDDKENLGE